MKTRQTGFTLVEILVVLTIISLLAGVITVSVLSSTAESRDAQRKADLRLVQNALELYKLDHGRYPEGCRGSETWAGQIDTNFECPDGGSDYIRGDVSRPFSPGYLPTLPTDPKLSGQNSGYVYKTNSNGTVYKFVVRNTLETEIYNSYGREFQACDVIEDLLGEIRSGPIPAPLPITCVNHYYNSPLPPEGGRCALGSCNLVRSGGSFYRPADANNECEISNIEKSMAVWGGFADPSEVVMVGTDEAKVERGTERIICDLPN